MKHGYKIRTYQHGQRGASASVFLDGVEVHRSRTIQGDPWEGYRDGSDRRAAAFEARAWIREQRQAGNADREYTRSLRPLSLLGVCNGF